jgi:hypothetical protein
VFDGRRKWSLLLIPVVVWRGIEVFTARTLLGHLWYMAWLAIAAGIAWRYWTRPRPSKPVLPPSKLPWSKKGWDDVWSDE